MSASTIARWNAIPLSRTEDSPSLKRPRSEDNDDDDNMSLVSRSPSPSEAMDVDDGHIHKYDEYVRGTSREVITVETRLKSTNKGFAMLAKLGWTEGQPLGLSGDGRVDPVPFHLKRDLTGLGKTNQDVRMIETTVSQRRELDSERQQKENEGQRKAREDLVARKAALDSEISTTLKAFYCTLCDKQFKTVAQYDEHTNSYAHHHKARFKDMQANVRIIPKDEADKRKEKERKREEKELRKIAAASGIKIPKPAAALSGSLAPVSAPVASGSESTNAGPAAAEPKRGGWATIAPPQGSASPFTQPEAKKSGWAAVGSSSFAVPPSDSSRTSSNAPPPQSQEHHHSSPPAFRTAGWTSLDTGSSQLTPPPPPPSAPFGIPPPPPDTAPPAPPSRGGWASVSTSGYRPPAGASYTQAALSSQRQPPPPPQESVTPNPSAQRPAAQPQPVRTGWQQFQKSAPRRK